MTGSAGSSESIAQRLKRLRLERGLSQRELAAPGVSYAYISRIEAGTRQPSVKALRQLAAKLSVSPEYLETGSDLDAAETRELRLGDAELALRLGDSSGAGKTIEDVLAESVRAGDVPNATRARIALAFVAHERGEHKRSVRLFEEAIAGGSVSAVERLDVYVTFARAYALAGAAGRVVELLEQCLASVRASEAYDPAVEVRYATALSYALSDSGDLARAGDVLTEALDRAREGADDPYMRVRLYWSLARLAEMRGKPSAALHHIRRAMGLLEAADDTLHLGRAHLMCAGILSSQGNPSAALDQLEDAERLLGTLASPDDRAMLRVQRSRALAALGDGPAAVVAAREAVEIASGLNEPELGSAYAALGEGLTLSGELEAADDAFGRAVDILEEQARWREATSAAQAWGKMLRRAGREAEALDVLERASALGLRLGSASHVER